MDGVLVLDGKIPHVDFSSRELFYVYSIAGILKLFGTNIISGRLLAVSCSLLIGIVVFLLARALFDKHVALLACGIYWMLPLELIQSALVKTEPLAVLLTCMAFFAVVRFSHLGQQLWLIPAGVLAGLAFHARPSAIIILFAVCGFLMIWERGQIREAAKDLGFFLAGYGAVILFVLAYYSRFMSLGDLLTSGLSPLRFLTWPLLAVYGLSMGSPDVITSQAATVPWDRYDRTLAEALYLHYFLLMGLVFSALEFGYHLLIQNREKIRGYIVSHSLLWLWVFFLFIGYVFYFYVRGFFIDYFREFLPPLVIIFSAWLRYSVPGLERDGVMERFVLGGLGLSAVWFFVQSHYAQFFGIGHHASIAIALMSLFTFAGALESTVRRCVFMSISVAIVGFIVVSRQAPFEAYFSGTVPSLVMIGMIYGLTWSLLGERARPRLRQYGKFMSLSIVLASFVVSVSFSARLLSLTYAAEWSPQSVKRISSYLKAQTKEADEVMSGAVIWEFQGLRRPFEMISHPLRFEYRISDEEKAAIERAAATRPPKVIILDGYTEKTYMRHVPWLMKLLQARYQFVTVAGPAVYPVRVYRLREESERITP